MKHHLCNCVDPYRKICPALKRIRRGWAVALIMGGETYARAAELAGVGHGRIHEYARDLGAPLQGRGRYQQRRAA